jgi:putative ABC transport system permease protein
MISLAGRDILHARGGSSSFTGIGLGLLIGVTLDHGRVSIAAWSMTAKPCSTTAGLTLWVVQKGHLGSVCGIVQHQLTTCTAAVRAMPGVAAGGQRDLPDHAGAQGRWRARAGCARHGGGHCGRRSRASRRAGHLTSSAGRQITRGHYEAVADIASPGFKLGDAHRKFAAGHYTVVGLTRRTVSSSGDPMIFIPTQGRPGGPVPQGQRCHSDAEPSSHRGQPGLQPARRARSCSMP